ncbi:MarR family winged helix-turn-helix transcriptional regulator [Streptomyces sp. NPDC093795]|uniref:MarR family winged helix-turn-helix transcriptional regulator n=1 Tax=Streptomyces sp. NPDC093795 TaxID=3366051 RepID=UPI00382F4BF1
MNDSEARTQPDEDETAISAGATSAATAAALVALAENVTLRAAGFDTTPAMRALTALATGAPLSAGDLARTLGVTPATMSRMCGRLETAGLLVRASDVDDRRRTLLNLTPAGERAAVGIRDRRAQALAAALPLTWGSEEVRHALEVVRDQLRRATNTRDRHPPPTNVPRRM